MAAATRKRPAPDGPSCSSATGKMIPRYQFGSIRDYDKQEVLGEGTYGVVAKARHLPSGDIAAVKWCARPTSSRSCAGVAADEATGDLFFVTELVDGPCLRDRLTRRFSEAETRRFILQLLRGLEGIHGAGAVHRDVKPENVIVGPGGALKICDFGMAAPVRPPYREECVGSLWYRSPKQLMAAGATGPPWTCGRSGE
jgi:cell division cycle 2-like